jgi:soluble lytic murein transglycosylase
LYWLGRVAEAEGNPAEAKAQYERAARFSTAFYGQIAAARLKAAALSLPAPAATDQTAMTRFAGRELVQALVQARTSGEDDSAGLLFQKLSATLIDPAEFTLLARLAEDDRRYSTVVEIGKAAQARGLPVGTLAFPANALPAYPGPAKIELPVLYAIARQESTFDQSVVSSAGAVGIFQVMPQYAKETAQKAGIPFAKERVRGDPIYNMQLGAAELAGLVSDYDGSYLLAFAAYNAGPARVEQWLKAYGDPRDPRVDVLDWIERIPFDETRNYVQRVLENLQVYRALLGDPVLRIDADMRGRSATSLAEDTAGGVKRPTG